MSMHWLNWIWIGILVSSAAILDFDTLHIKTRMAVQIKGDSNQKWAQMGQPSPDPLPKQFSSNDLINYLSVSRFAVGTKWSWCDCTRKATELKQKEREKKISQAQVLWRARCSAVSGCTREEERREKQGKPNGKWWPPVPIENTLWTRAADLFQHKEKNQGGQASNEAKSWVCWVC